MRKYNVQITEYLQRIITVEAESEEEIWDRLKNGKSLAGEISRLGLGNIPGRTVKYEFLEDKVEPVNVVKEL